MSITVQNIIESSLKLLGVLGDGSTLTASEYADALVVLNDMIDSWNIDNGMIYSNDITTFPLVASQQVYTVGTGANFSMQRPAKIERASLIYTPGTGPNVEIPLEILDDDAWQAVTVKSTPSSYPLYVYNDGSYPFLNLFFWPVPSSACSVTLYTWNPIETLASLTSPVSLPQGYARALKYNLAIDLAPMFDKEPSDMVVRTAVTARKALKLSNEDHPIAKADGSFCSGGSNSDGIKSRGWYVG